jgi:hypothetical protein
MIPSVQSIHFQKECMVGMFFGIRGRALQELSPRPFSIYLPHEALVDRQEAASALHSRVADPIPDIGTINLDWSF